LTQLKKIPKVEIEIRKFILLQPLTTVWQYGEFW